MSIFGDNNLYGTDSVTALENYTIHGGDLLAIEEAAVDMIGIIESIHAHDMQEIERDSKIISLENQGARDYEIEQVRESYEPILEGAVKDTKDKILNALRKLWAKIKGYMKNMIRFFDGFILSGKKFVTKYESQLNTLNLTGYEYKMHNWNNANLDNVESKDLFVGYVEGTINSKVTGSEEEQAKYISEKRTDIMNAIRGKFVGESSVESEDYNEKIFAYFRNGATSNDDRDDVKVDIFKCITALKNDKPLKAVKKMEKDVDKLFAKKIKELNSIKSATEKGFSESRKNGGEGDKSSQTSILLQQKVISLFNDATSVALTFVRGWKDAYVKRNSEYKGACVAAFRYKEDK